MYFDIFIMLSSCKHGKGYFFFPMTTENTGFCLHFGCHFIFANLKMNVIKYKILLNRLEFSTQSLKLLN